MTNKFFAIATFFVFAMAAQAGTQTTQFINVDFTAQEAEGAPAKIKLRIPMSLVNAMAPQLEEAFNQAQVQGDVDLRQMWSEIEASGPMRFAEIQSDDAAVTVDTTEDHLKVAIDSEQEGRFNITVPLALGNALFGDESGDFHQLVAALQELEGDLVTIEGDKINGRIWVD